MIVKNIFKISKGKKAVESIDKTLQRYIQIGDLRSDDKIKYAESDDKNVICDENDVLIAWDGANAGTIGYGLKGIIGSTLARLSPKVDNIYSPYAGRFLQSQFRYLRETCTGATIPHISRPTLESLKIPLPPLDQQKKIAAILDAADAYRQKTKALITKYEELTQSLFLDMFGDPVRNPMGWKVVLMKEACTKVTDGTHDTPLRLTEGIKFITGKHIRPYTVDYNNSDYVTKDVHDEIFRRCNPALGDVLYTNIGVNLGTAALNKVEYEFSMKNVALLKPKSAVITGRYMEYFLNSENMKEKIVWTGSLGGAQQFLSLTLLRRLKINLPPLDLQNQFAERVQAIEIQKVQAQASLEQAEDLFNSLLQKAFKGELV